MGNLGETWAKLKKYIIPPILFTQFQWQRREFQPVLS